MKKHGVMMMVLGIKFKRCYRCKRWAVLSPADFHRNKSTADGYRDMCKVCAIAVQKDSAAHRKAVYRYRSKERRARNAYTRQEVQIIDGQQRCTGCEKWKPLAEYYKDNARKSGYTSRCKECVKKYQRKLKKKHKHGNQNNYRPPARVAD